MKYIFLKNGFHLHLRILVTQCVTLANGKWKVDVQVEIRQNANETRISSLNTVPCVVEGSRIEIVIRKVLMSKFFIGFILESIPLDCIYKPYLPQNNLSC
jgi:hypothetical protein